MRARFEFDRRGFDELRRKLHGMRERAGNMIPAWDALLDWWAKENQAHFRSTGKRWKTPWPKLAQSTIEEKLRLGFPRDTLVRTGDLRTDLTLRPLGVERLTPHEVEAGTGIKYAKFHQKGTKRMPRRALVNAKRVQEEGAATNAVANWIIDGKQSTEKRT